MKFSQQNDRQSPSFYIHKELEDYVAAGVLSINDMDISDSQYTKEIVPGVKNLARFLIAEYNEQAVSPAHIDIVKDKLKEYYIEYLTTEEAIAWLKANTSCVETTPGVFRVQEANEELGIEEGFITID